MEGGNEMSEALRPRFGCLAFLMCGLAGFGLPVVVSVRQSDARMVTRK